MVRSWPSSTATRLVVVLKIIFMVTAVTGGWRATIIAVERLMG
jgi:hypothetical protein